MDEPFYEFEISQDSFKYEFKSKGRKEIDKVVLFQNMKYSKLFQPCFG